MEEGVEKERMDSNEMDLENDVLQEMEKKEVYRIKYMKIDVDRCPREWNRT